jgi:hypothetical protein
LETSPRDLQYATPVGARYYKRAAQFDALRAGRRLPNALAVAAVVGGIYAKSESLSGSFII